MAYDLSEYATARSLLQLSETSATSVHGSTYLMHSTENKESGTVPTEQLESPRDPQVSLLPLTHKPATALTNRRVSRLPGLKKFRENFRGTSTKLTPEVKQKRKKLFNLFLETIQNKKTRFATHTI